MGRKRVKKISYEWGANRIVKLENGKEALKTDIEKKPKLGDPNPSFAKTHQRYLDRKKK